ncbi:hypothetical protein [Methyloceanibacter methanicus]|uniref:hypothetical protein n=1 Tax=Methyloceanibacter methanicus TaxID=1774968 RepID=UPI00114CEA74|nr:hypothetical protein [Methyloceanibacter methanicus]
MDPHGGYAWRENLPQTGPPYQLRRLPVLIRFSTITATIAVAALSIGIVSAHADDKTPIRRDLNKTYEELTPSEHIAIRAAAKAAYKGKKLKTLNICADPGNMPLSNIQREASRTRLPNCWPTRPAPRSNIIGSPSSNAVSPARPSTSAFAT